jgi:acyl carrier protein
MHKEYAQQNLETVKEILCRLLSVEDISADEDIYQAGLTSIMVLPLLAEIEDKFQLTIPDNDFLNARTPMALAELVQRLRAN